MNTITIEDLIKKLEKLPKTATIGFAVDTHGYGYYDKNMNVIKEDEIEELIKPVEHWDNEDCCYTYGDNDKELKADYYFDII